MALSTKASAREITSELKPASNNQQRLPRDISADPTPGNHASIPQHDSLKMPGQIVDSKFYPQTVDLTQSKRFAHITREMADRIAIENKRLSQASGSSGKPSPSAKIKRYVGPWLLGKDLGKGMSSRVRKAQHHDTGQLAAVKIIDIRKAARLQTASVIAIDKQLRSAKSARTPLDNVPALLQREIVILKATEHPNIIKLYDVWENRGELYLFTEYAENGELLNYIIDRGHLDEEESVRIFRQLVSGLQYCHRFLLCHRDLKPENILLDHNYNVKLADFGLAAMQHNQLLRTSCGSPHYAAPELLRGQPYRGSLADTWSCGVILFVMMCGKVPFGGEFDVDRLAKLCNAVLHDPLTFSNLPSRVSDVAMNLIRRLLERNPARRMTLDEVWRHPLLTGYELVALQPKNRSRWLGSPLQALTVEDCGAQLRNAHEIDRAAIRGLCVLWQTDDEDRFVHALLGDKACYEKVLYQRLSRYRTEQEENLHGPTLKISSSDYHHLPPPSISVRSRTKSSLLGSGAGAQPGSQFSLVVPGHRHPSVRSQRTSRSGSMSGSGSGSRRTRSFAETETTYDPYRSSKPQVVYRGNSYTKVNVYRDGSVSSRPGSSYKRRLAVRPPVSSIWESTIGPSLVSMASSPPELPRDLNGRYRTLRHTTVRRCVSRSSLTNSLDSQASSRSVSFRRSSSYKRNVSFRTPSHYPPRPSAPTPMSEQQRYLCDRLLEETPELDLSPGNRKASTGISMPLMTNVSCEAPGGSSHRERLVQSSGSICDNHAPHQAAIRAGSELSEYCDAAFSSTPATAGSARAAGHPDAFVDTPTPITGLENAALLARLISTGNSNDAKSHLRAINDKTLPEVPMREPHALQMQRMLARALQNLKERDKEIGKGILDGAMAEIERVMRVNAPGIASDNYRHRVASSYDKRVSSDMSNKPVSDFAAKLAQEAITESQSEDNKQGERRYFSDPLPRVIYQARAPPEPILPAQTIRVVPKSPAVYQLQADDLDGTIIGGLAVDQTERVNEPRVIPRRRDSRDFSRLYAEAAAHEAFERSPMENRLQTIQEIDDHDNEEGQSKRGSGSNKFKSWFRRSNGSARSLEKTAGSDVLAIEQTGASQRTSAVQGLDIVESWQNMAEAATMNAAGPVADPSYATTESEFPSRGTGQKATKGLFSFLRRPKQPGMQLVELSDIESLGGVSSMGSRRCSTMQDSALNVASPDATHSPYPSLLRPGGGAEAEPTNWLARLLQVRPAARTLAFDATSVRMLREIRNVFRTWRRHGVRDVVFDRLTGRIWARLTNDNDLSIKPVEIMVEVYGIVYSNRTRQRTVGGGGGGGGMAIARMQQMRGARSSFEKCANELARVCKERGLLVSDKKKAREMKRCLNSWRR